VRDDKCQYGREGVACARHQRELLGTRGLKHGQEAVKPSRGGGKARAWGLEDSSIQRWSSETICAARNGGGTALFCPILHHSALVFRVSRAVIRGASRVNWNLQRHAVQYK
jgi:hypothetical protein